LIELVQDCRRFLIENFARSGRPDASGAALKKHDAEPLLQLGDLLAQGRLRDMDDGSRAGKAASVDNFHEISELAELHMTYVELRPDIIHCSAFFASSRVELSLFGSRRTSEGFVTTVLPATGRSHRQAGHGSVMRF
jgi:hypothetical protein